MDLTGNQRLRVTLVHAERFKSTPQSLFLLFSKFRRFPADCSYMKMFGSFRRWTLQASAFLTFIFIFLSANKSSLKTHFKLLKSVFSLMFFSVNSPYFYLLVSIFLFLALSLHLLLLALATSSPVSPGSKDPDFPVIWLIC